MEVYRVVSLPVGTNLNMTAIINHHLHAVPSLSSSLIVILQTIVDSSGSSFLCIITV